MLAVAMLLTACAGPWESAPNHLDAASWRVTVPDGWMHLHMPQAHMLSQNGPYLEYILIESRPLTQGFRYTRQAFTADMLPHEAAQLVVDSLTSDPHIRNFRLLASEPASVAGRSGFRLTYRYRDKHDVDTQTVYYGVLLSDRFFNIRYTAARRCYFDLGWPVFTKVFNSLRFASDRIAQPSIDLFTEPVAAPRQCGTGLLASETSGPPCTPGGMHPDF